MVVEYNIVHSTSYQVPALYFFLHGLSASKSRDLDTVYEVLVPHRLAAAAKQVGVIGGIGMTVSHSGMSFNEALID